MTIDLLGQLHADPSFGNRIFFDVAALGVVTGGWYAAGIDSPENKRFVEAMNKEYKEDPGFYSIGAYSAGLVFEEAAKAVKGKVETDQNSVRATTSTASNAARRPDSDVARMSFTASRCQPSNVYPSRPASSTSSPPHEAPRARASTPPRGWSRSPRTTSP